MTYLTHYTCVYTYSLTHPYTHTLYIITLFITAHEALHHHFTYII